jgi:chromosome partitioning protein
MRKIALVNHKGGCGKTTTAINVASCLAGGGKKVLLIDLDPQGHVALGFGVRPDQVERSIYEVLLGEIPISTAIQILRQNLAAVLSDVLLSAFEQVMAGAREREYKLKRSLEDIQSNYDYLIIDSPPSLGLLTFNGLMASQEVIIPVDPSFFSLQGLERLLETIQIIEEKVGHQLSVKILAINIDRRTKFSRGVVETLKARFAENCYKTIINTCTTLREATSQGKPITEYDSRCPAFGDYQSLTREILDEETEWQTRYFAPLDFQRLNLRELLPLPWKSKGSPWEVEGRVQQSAKREIVFSIEAMGKSIVQIAGDFNNWVPEPLYLKEVQGRRVWSKAISMKPGSYSYKYLVDDHWLPDPANNRLIDDSYGGMNSIIDV